MRSVAVVGSSGGGAATLGHTDPADLLRTIESELGRVAAAAASAQSGDGDDDDDGPTTVVASIRHALYVSLHGGRGLDSADGGAQATLYAVGCAGDDSSGAAAAADGGGGAFPVRVVCSGPLAAVNDTCRRLDETHVASAVRSGRIAGLICISADPTDINRASISAAAASGVPVTGSGGTSLSVAVAELGANLVGNAGGSVATTSYTRAVSYVAALAGAWDGCAYSPFAPKGGGSGGGDGSGGEAVRPRIGSVLDSCVPAFVAVCVACRLLESIASLLGRDVLVDADSMMNSARSVFAHSEEGDWINPLLYGLRFHALPTVCAVVSGTAYAPEFGSVAVMGAGVASAACGGSVLAGLLAGWLVSWLVSRALFACIKLNVPATATNIIVAGGVGSAVAVALGGSGLVSALACATDHLRSVVRLAFLPDGTAPPGVGFVFGTIFCYGGKVGWYHAVFLPVILVEMERGQPSVWGACDECALVMVSAGICLANILTANRPSTEESPSTSSRDIPISRRGLKINLVYGDFIEAAYPFMERSKIVNAFAYIASGVSTEILYRRNPRGVFSSAYLCVVISVWLSEDWRRTALACGAALGISFLGAVLANLISRRQPVPHKAKSR